MTSPTYSKADTPETQKQVKTAAVEIREHNAARGSVCGTPRKPMV
jgi:hypothetical protein